MEFKGPGKPVLEKYLYLVFTVDDILILWIYMEN